MVGAQHDRLARRVGAADPPRCSDVAVEGVDRPVLGTGRSPVAGRVDLSPVLLDHRSARVGRARERIEPEVVVVRVVEGLARALCRALGGLQRVEPVLDPSPVRVGHHQAGAVVERAAQRSIVE